MRAFVIIFDDKKYYFFMTGLFTICYSCCQGRN